MNRPLSLRLWLHRIGYVTTAIIAAELLLMAGFGAASAATFQPLSAAQLD